MNVEWLGKDRYSRLIGEDWLDGSVYTDPQIFEEEIDKIFYRGWVFVGHDSEIPNPGDYVTRMLGREPVMMQRNARGEVKVLVNRCTHRGNLLRNRDSGNARAITCPYHGWSFSLDGDLVDVPYRGGFKKDCSGLGLDRPVMVDSVHGFVFASFNPNVESLTSFLGGAITLFDRMAEQSPVGKIRLSAGWIKQKFDSNWKMLPENDTDGYHVNSVHLSFVRAIRSQYDSNLTAPEDQVEGITRDWGHGHSEIDFGPSYRHPLQWMGTSGDKFPEYVQSMEQAYGREKANELLTLGPPHAVLFPNLFLGEGNVVIFQPIDVNTSVQWHTPLQLEGVPEALNERLVRQSIAAMGPSAFLLADDAIIAERTQTALKGRSARLDLSRGLEREQRNGEVIVSHLTDETTNRSFWQHYRSVMSI